MSDDFAESSFVSRGNTCQGELYSVLVRPGTSSLKKVETTNLVPGACYSSLMILDMWQSQDLIVHLEHPGNCALHLGDFAPCSVSESLSLVSRSLGSTSWYA